MTLAGPKGVVSICARWSSRVSFEYCTRLERGNLTGVSEDVLEAIARALRPAETARSTDGN